MTDAQLIEKWKPMMQGVGSIDSVPKEDWLLCAKKLEKSENLCMNNTNLDPKDVITLTRIHYKDDFIFDMDINDLLKGK